MSSPQSTQDDATVPLPNGLGNRLPVVPKLGLRRRARRQLVPRNAARPLKDEEILFVVKSASIHSDSTFCLSI